jgi:(S)-ureidoglycine aminohydrolase
MPAFVPPGVIGHNRTIVTPHYAVLPPDGMFPSLLPGLRDAMVFFQATPLMGARFAQGRLEVAPGGGTTAPRDDGLEHFFYVLDGTLEVAAGDTTQRLDRHRLWLPQRRCHPGAGQLAEAPLPRRPRHRRAQAPLRQPGGDAGQPCR